MNDKEKLNKGRLQISIVLPDELVKLVEAEAEKEKRSRSNMIIALVWRGLER